VSLSVSVPWNLSYTPFAHLVVYLRCVCRVARERDSVVDVHAVLWSHGDGPVAQRSVQLLATQEDLLLPLGRRNLRHLRSALFHPPSPASSLAGPAAYMLYLCYCIFGPIGP